MTHENSVTSASSSRFSDANTLPHIARPLSPADERRQDTYAFESPMNQRQVVVVEPARLAIDDAHRKP